MTLLDRMPIYKVNGRDESIRDGFYAKLNLNKGGASLFRGVSSLTKELDAYLIEFNKTKTTADTDFAIQIEVLLFLVGKCWDDTIECLYPESCLEKERLIKLNNEIKSNVDFAENHIRYDDEPLIRYCPEIFELTAHLQNDIVKELLKVIASIM